MQARPSSNTQPAKPRRRRQRAAARPSPFLQVLPAPLRRWLTEESTPVLQTLRFGPILALLLLTIPILTLAYQFPRVHEIGAATRNADLFLRGFSPPEQTGSTDFRWIGAQAEITIPAAAGNSAWNLVLRVGSQRPAGLPSPPLDLFVDDRLIAHVETVPEFRDYRFPITRPLLAPENLTIRLATTTFDPPGTTDDRQLGLAVSSLTLTPQGGIWRPVLPPLGYALLVLLLVVVLAGLLARLGVERRIVAGVLAVALGGIAIGQVLRPDYTALFLRALLIVVPILILTLLGLRALVRRLFVAGGVALTPRQEQILLGIVLFGAFFHLAGMVFPGFRSHDLGFHANRVDDILHGRFLLTSVVSEWGFRRTPYGPALYVLAAPIAALARDTTWPLRYLVPVLDATSAILVCYLLHRCRLPEPAPLLGAFFAAIVPASSQLLWWGFFSNLFGQWTTLVVLTLVIGHWADLPKRAFLGTLVVFLSLTLLSHPGTFVLTVALLPLLGLAFGLVQPTERRSVLALAAALILSVLVVYLLYYRFFTTLLIDGVRGMLTGTAPTLPDNADDSRGWEANYVYLRFFALPFLLYFAAALVAGVSLARQRIALGWALLALLLTGTIFAIVHITVGVWVRYFVFVSPALAIGAALGVAWFLQRGRLGKIVAYAALAYFTTAGLYFWLTITVLGNRSPYP